jgi:predicted PurR-regulated permease PerM
MPEPAPRAADERRDGERAQTIRIRDMPAELAWKLAGAAAVSLALGFLFLYVLTMMIRPLGILLAGIVVAMTLAPLADLLERWLPRLLAVVSIYLVALLVLVGLGFILIPPLVDQASSFVDVLPDRAEDARAWVEEQTGITFEDNMEHLTGYLEPAAGALVAIPTLIVETILEIFIGLFISLYWLHSMPRLKAFCVSLFPPDQQHEASEVLARIGQRMGGYMRGVAITGVVIGTVVFIGLTILGVQFALFLAILSFFGEFFPNVGPVLAAIPAVFVAMFDSFGLALVVIAFYVVIQQLESYILMPVIMRGQTKIPPLVTTFAVFTGFVVGGVLWAILAIPISGALLTLTTDVAAPAIRRRTGATATHNRQSSRFDSV